MLQRRDSSLLEIEAADYFKLDAAQVHLFNRSTQCDLSKIDYEKFNQSTASKSNMAPKINFNPIKMHELDNSEFAKQKSLNLQKSCDNQLHASNSGSRKINHETKKQTDQNATRRLLDGGTRISDLNHDPLILASSGYLMSLSTTSTNSLPSISSSPSVSPSLVCPHLSLDDILGLHNDSKSPHTIGLCSKCRLDPPPNIHSPLSPAFKPSKCQVPQSSTSPQDERNDSKSKTSLRRGYSDHLASAYSARASTSRKQTLSLSDCLRDDSLDCCLQPSDLKRLQMSPTLRHSVEFIRNNSTESARVFKIYKNGQPFEAPLRIGVTRGEFATLNHLLDYINSRQVIPSGARYLFHLDGQLVYSVNELKHGSTYIVSGIRNFDHHANNILKEERKKLFRQCQDQHQQYLIRRQVKLKSSRLGATSEQHQRPFPLIVDTKPSEGVINQSKNSPVEAPCVNRKSNLEKMEDPVKKKKEIQEVRLATKFTAQSKPRESLGKLPVTRRNRTPAITSNKSSKRNENEAADPLSKSNENLTYGHKEEEKSVNIVRAKSELSTLPNKRKKNVTFMDTSRSPSIREQMNHDVLDKDETFSSVKEDHSQPEKINSETRAMNTNDIGIQVSDSIEGYLIDLPLPMPPKGDNKRRYLKKGYGAQASGQRATKKVLGNKLTASSNGKASKQQVVTITERQLSLDEMDKFKDLDHGNHHHSDSNKHQHVSRESDNLEAGTGTTDKSRGDNEVVSLSDRSNVIMIGQTLDRKTPAPTTKGKDQGEEEETKWQYPGGRQISATPTERPVSQSDANETVCARVTTPTPSLSTAGENNSLSMSYEPSVSCLQREDSKQSTQLDLTKKQRIPVIGKLCKGINLPTKNFKLTWVNGFIINDKYPDNSTTFVTQTPQNKSTNEMASLSPSHAPKHFLSQFKPSERFHNWIYHSSQHDELIYPSGNLVILWCRWTNEQRYYSKHTSNVSAITLDSLDVDLAVSAQIGDQSEKISSLVHLWSLTSLQTLLVVDDDQFHGRKIFSLKVRNTKTDSCEMSVGAKDDKRLWLYIFHLKLDKTKEANGGKAVVKFNKKSNIQPMTVMKVNKLLQSNQVPLLVTRMSNVRGQQPTTVSLENRQQQQQQQQQLDDVMLSFGRSHFQVWFTDRKNQKLQLMQCQNKSSEFLDMIVKVNCLIRMSPIEFITGDSDGNITLLVITFPDSKSSKISLLENKDQKYNIETVPLFRSATTQMSATTGGDGSTSNASSITCLSRISASIFASGDSTCMVKFWKIDRLKNSTVGNRETVKQDNSSSLDLTCRQLNCISLPRDLGFICTIILSKYNHKQPMVEFYVVSTSNAILFGSVQLRMNPETAETKGILDNSSLSVVYEGHETSVVNLVADLPKPENRNRNTTAETNDAEHNNYFTCSLDCKICKWNGKNLVWKSMLPSACVSLAVHPIGSVLAVGSADGTVYVLDKISGLLISYFPLTPVYINCLAYSRDGSLLAAGCANGSIFILPVYERGLKYKKVSIFQSPYAVVSLQFSIDNQYILTSVTHGSYQELILWDLPNFRYMRDNVKVAADKIEWFDSICSGSEDVRAIWENANLTSVSNELVPKAKFMAKRLSIAETDSLVESTSTVINLSCHRLVRSNQQSTGDLSKENFVVASDTRGHLRLFRYPCYDIQQGFFEIRISSSAVNCCRFLASNDKTFNEAMFVSSSLDGSICLWILD